MENTDGDHAQAAREAEARKQLLDAGASGLPRAPWLHDGQPPSATDLMRFALWRGDQNAVLAALALAPAARAEMDQIEAALLFLARSHGLSWPQISRAMSLASPQAAQQRFDRVSTRVDRRSES